MSIPPEAARMWADRLAQHIADLEHQLMFLAVCDPDLEDVLDGLEALAHDILQAADR